MPTVEQLISDLTTATTELTIAVGTQQLSVTTAVDQFTNTINKANTELNNVDNTSDLNKPKSTSVLEALALKQDELQSGVNISTVNGQSLLSGAALVIERSVTSLVSLAYNNRATLRAFSNLEFNTTAISAITGAGIGYISMV